MHFSGKIIPFLYQCCCLSLLLICNVSLAGQPAVASNAYFGGGYDEQVNAVTTDASGNIYVTGWTRSAGLPGADVTLTNLSSGLIGYPPQDAFVTKMDAAGNVLFTRYIGAADAGSFDDKEAGQAIAVDVTGMIYIAGSLAGNVHFAGTSGAYDNCDNGGVDAFIAVIDGSNSVDKYPLKYLSCFGGSYGDYVTDLVLNNDGSVTVVGYTQSTETTFPLKNEIQKTKDYNDDAFIIRLMPSGNGVDDLLFASYLGGNGSDQANGVDVDAQGNLYIVGATSSTNLSSDIIAGSYDAFVARLNISTVVTSGYDAPQYVHLLTNDDNGINCDSGADIAVDTQTGHVYMTGRFGSQGAFIARMDANGQNINSTIIGGSVDKSSCGVTAGQAIVLDGNGGGFIGGVTDANDLPATANTYSGLTDGFITRFDTSLNPLYTYYLGGSMDDAILAIDRLDSGFLLLAGVTNSADLPVTDSSTPLGGRDVFLAGLNPEVDLSIDTVSQIPVLVGGARQFDITLRNSGPDTAHDISLEVFPPADYPGDISIVQGDCSLTLISSIMCTLPGINVPSAAGIPLTVSVSSAQQGTWSLGYALTNPAYEQTPADNQGDLALSFVDQLPPTVVVTDGSSNGQSSGGGGILVQMTFLLCLLYLSRSCSWRIITCKLMK